MSPNEKVLKLSAENEVLLKNLNRLTKIEADNKQKLEKIKALYLIFTLFCINLRSIFFPQYFKKMFFGGLLKVKI